MDWRDGERRGRSSRVGTPFVPGSDWEGEEREVPDLEEHLHDHDRERERELRGTSPVSSNSTAQVHPHSHSRLLSRPPFSWNTSTIIQGRVLQGTVARATVDTTLAVIPAEAFARVTKKFPKASAHIVQGTSPYFLVTVLN